MNPADPAETDLVTLPSVHGVTETVERHKALVAQKGIELFAHIVIVLPFIEAAVSRCLLHQNAGHLTSRIGLAAASD
jgi:hypothetical protein